jgi:hypothetical protein
MNIKKRMKNNNILLKLASLMFGFAFWYLCMHHTTGYQQLLVPLSFHDIPNNVVIDAPETVAITVRGNRAVFHTLDREVLVFHINASNLNKGENTIRLSDQPLFLPEQLRLLNCSPSTILVYVHDKKEVPSSSSKGPTT